MNLQEALEIFNYISVLNITFEDLKKKYHCLALQNHPDKLKTNDSTTKFQKINESYDILKKEIELINKYENYNHNDNENVNEDFIKQNKFGYMYLLNLFVDEILKGKYNDFIAATVKDIVSGYKEITIKIFEGMDKERAINVYNLLFKYKNILHINEITIEKIKEIILEKYKDVQIFVLNPTINDLFNDNVYKLAIESELYFVPLWHSEVVFDGKNGDIIVKCIPDLPSHILIDKSDLIVTLEIPFDKKLLENSSYLFFLGKTAYSLLLHDIVIKKEQYYTLKKKGISIPKENIYDITDKGDMIIHILFV